MRFLFSIVCLFVIQLLFGQFKDVSSQQGINQVSNIALFIGGGACFIDYNNDGWEDLYVTGSIDGNKLFHNTGKEFVDISSYSLVKAHTEGIYTSGVISGDVNNDGCQDLFVTTLDNSHNILMLGRCDGKFYNESISWNLSNDLARSSAATFLDFNKDGFLDIYVTNYVKDSKFLRDEAGEIVGFDHTFYQDFLYQNVNGERFERIELVEGTGCGLSVVANDYDLDGHEELMVINDFGEWVLPNRLFNNHDGSFEEVSSDLNFDIGVYGMGVASGDVNDDGYTDFYVTNIGENHMMVYNPEIAKFENKALQLGVQDGLVGDKLTTGWGCTFFDFDNDEDLDLYVANGFISVADFIKNAFRNPNKLFRNDGGIFQDISEESKADSDLLSRSAIYGDYDNDGDMDLFVSNIVHDQIPESKSTLYQNNYAQGNYLKFSLKGVSSNPNGFGTKIELHYDEKIQTRHLTSGGSHASQNSQIVHFGLSDLSVIEEVRVIWPNGTDQIFFNVNTNSHYFLEEGRQLYRVGCMDESNEFFDPQAEINRGCLNEIRGCTDPFSINFDSQAIVDDGSCEREQVIELGIKDPDFSIYPTLFDSEIKIEFNLSSFQEYEYKIHDLSGNIVLMGVVNSKEPIINAAIISDGIYLISLSLPDNSFSKKIIKGN